MGRPGSAASCTCSETCVCCSSQGGTAGRPAKSCGAAFAESDPASVRAAYYAAIDAIAGLSGKAAELLQEAKMDAPEGELPPEPGINAETSLRAELPACPRKSPSRAKMHAF